MQELLLKIKFISNLSLFFNKSIANNFKLNLDHFDQYF